MNIVSSFVQKMASAYPQFTRSEILVANLIRDGKTIKEIAKDIRSIGERRQPAQTEYQKQAGTEQTKGKSQSLPHVVQLI